MCASEPSWQGGAYYYRCGIAESSEESKDESASKLLWERTSAWAGTLVKTGDEEHERD